MKDFWIITIGMQASFFFGLVVGCWHGSRRTKRLGNYTPRTAEMPEGSIPPKPRKS